MNSYGPTECTDIAAYHHLTDLEDYDNTIKYDGVICAAAPREYPYELVDSLNISAKIVIPVGNSKSQKLNVINKISSNEVEQDLYDDVSFVPMLPGKSEDGLDS